MSAIRFSPEYIRRQPEYQYLITEQTKPGKVSINLNDLSLRIIEPKKEGEVKESTIRSATRRYKDFNLDRGTTLSRPLTASSVSPSSSSLSVICSTMDRKKRHERPKTTATRYKAEREIRTHTGSPNSTSFKYSTMENKPSHGRSNNTSPSNESVLHKEHGVRNIHSSVQLHRPSINYDPCLEKTHQFLKGFGSSFSQASQALVPVKRGLSRVEVHYSESNLNQNDSLIFADLIRNSHRTNIIFQENVGGLERRLLTNRGVLKRATTFYDTVLRPPTTPTLRSAKNRTVAGKKDERNKRIKKKNKKIELGYEPRAWSLHDQSQEEFQKVLECRYLRVSPKYQPELYGI